MTEDLRDRVVTAVVDWHRSRREAETLKAKRATFMCERSTKFEEDFLVPFTREDPATTCWKKIIPAHADGSEEGVEPSRLEPEEQCASCRERYAVHLAMKAAIRRRGAAQGRMRKLATQLAAETRTAPA